MNVVSVQATVPSTDDRNAITAAIASLKQRLPFLINFSKADRKTVTKPSAKGQTFIKEALDVAVQNPAMLPVSFEVNDLRNSSQLFEYLTSIQLPLRQLLQEIDDTTRQVGNQAYTAARAIYASASSQLAGPPLQLAADQLGKHFGRKPKAAKAAANGNGAATPAPVTTPPAHAAPGKSA